MKKKVTNIKWTEKILPLRDIGTEPPLNKEGFWKKPEYPEIKVSKDGGK